MPRTTNISSVVSHPHRFFWGPAAIIGTVLSIAVLLDADRAHAAWTLDSLFPASAPTPNAAPRVAVARLEIPANLIIPIIIRVETSFLHDALIDALVRTRTVDVVERTRIDKLLEEQGLTKSGVTDPGQAAALGKVLGAGSFVVGTLRDLQLKTSEQPPLPYTTKARRILTSRVHFDFRLFDVETSRVLDTGTIDARQDRTIDAGGDDEAQRELWESTQHEAATRFAAQVADTLTPLRIVRVEGQHAELNRGTASGIQEGFVCDVLDPRENRVAAVTISNATETHAVGELGGDPKDVQPDMLCRVRAMAPPPRPDARADPLQNRW